MTIAAVAATAGQQRRGEWGGRGSGAHQSQEVSLGARVLNSRYLLALPVLACRRQVDDGNGNGDGDGDGGIGGNDNRDRMLQIRYCFTLRLHSAFRISIVSPCLCLSVSSFLLLLPAFFAFVFVALREMLKRLLQFEQLAD